VMWKAYCDDDCDAVGNASTIGRAEFSQ